MTNKKIIAGLLLGGVAYWLFDSATDVFIFQEGTFRARAFSPPPHEIIMRAIIIALLAITSYVVLISTREKKTQSDLREKEKLLSESQRIAHIGSWVWEVATGAITWTEETYRIYGCSPETFVLSPDSFLGLLHPEDQPAMQEWIRACLAGNNPADLTVRALLPDGTVRFLNGRGGLERDAENKPVRMVGTVQDVTESKKSRDLLRQSEEKYRNLVERALDGIIIVQDGIIKFANSRMAELDGGSLEELIGTPYTAHIHPLELPRLMDIYRRRMAGETLPSTYETILQRKDGSPAPSELSAGVIMYNGKPADMVIIRDITERKRAEEALKESELRFSSLMQTASDGVIMSDAAGAIMTWNIGAEIIFGYTNKEALGKPLTMLMPERYRKEHLKGLERVSTSGTSQYLGRIMDFHGLRKDGNEFPLELSVTSWVTQKQVLFLGIIRDLTEHRTLEDQLRQAQKMEAIGQLAGGVAHDFNNILSAIIGYGSLAEMKLPEDHPVRSDLEQILQSAARATALTQSLLTFSRKQPVKMEPLELNSVIGGFEKFLTRLLREDIEMRTRYAGEKLTITADRGQIEQVVMNLVTNARDAMPAKGVLTIETSRTTMDGSFVAAHGYGRPGEYAMITVSDTGVGMDAETKRRIFEPFFTTKEQGKGTGLGLATVYGIVKSHDGFINVYSEPDRGTAFHIYIPLVRAGETAAEPVKQAPASLTGGVETILLAEDDASLRKMTSTVLKHMGYSVIEAENGREAVEKFIENKDVIRLVILDGIMPKMNGKEAHHEISALVPGVRCIFMSGYAEDVFTKDGILQTDVTFLSKPVTPSALLGKVREVLDR